MARKTLNSLKVGSIGWMKAAPLGAEAGRASIDRLRRKNATLRRTLARLLAFRAMAYRDPLTGLRNRRYFDERLAEEVERAHRNFGGGPSVIAIDINSFKQINDLEGHRAGDEVLKWVAAFLESTTRSYDICCRTGGGGVKANLPATGGNRSARPAQRPPGKISPGNAKTGASLGVRDVFGTRAGDLPRPTARPGAASRTESSSARSQPGIQLPMSVARWESWSRCLPV